MTSDPLPPSVAKKRRRKSSGKCKAAAKQAIRESRAALLSQVDGSDSSDDNLQPRSRPPPAPTTAPGHPDHPSNQTLPTPASQPSQISEPTAEFARLHRPHKPSADVLSGKGRQYTVSIAIPGSIVNNAQTWELKTALVGQIARACAIFSVDEIVIFDENLPDPEPGHKANNPAGYGRGKYRSTEDDELEQNGDHELFQPSHFVARILEYLECPQYLRKSLFPLHPDLRLAGLLPPLDLPHHFRREHHSPWREGCVLPAHKVENYIAGGYLQKSKSKKGAKGLQNSVWADVGLAEPVEVALEAGISVLEWTRVTVQMPLGEGKLARLVSPRLPTETAGVYWGYSIRLATSISKVFTETPYEKDGGYDLTIGTSERGRNIDDAISDVGNFKHLLLALGGLSGLELCISADSTLRPRLSAVDAPLLFDYWLNTLPYQGSRTVRTEEALLVSLGALQRLLFRS